MNCNNVSRILDDTDLRALSAPERREIDQHLSSCHSCASLWSAHAEVAARPIPKTPDDLLGRICRSIDENTARPEPASRFRSSLVVGGLVAIGAAAATTAVMQFGKSVDVPVAREDESAIESRQSTMSRSEADSYPQQQAADGSIEPEANSEPADDSSPDAYSLDANSVVVLPLDSHTKSPEFAGLADKINEHLLNKLGLIDGLNVISGGPVFPYTKSIAPEAEIARLFGAGSILVGSVTETDRDWMINISQIDAQTGKSKFSSGMTRGKRGEPVDWSRLAEWVQRVADHVAANLNREAEVQWSRPQFTLEKQAEILDFSLSDNDRVQALGSLRYAGDDARRGAVAAAAVQLAQNSSSPGLRRRVWQYMKGAGDPYLVQPLLQTLAFDSSQVVRREAAKTLEDFIAEPGVREALEYAIANDESQVVRDRAHFTLVSEQERQAIITGIVLNTSLSDRERLAPLWEQRFANGDEVELSDEAVSALVKMARNSDDPHIRGSVWRHLRGANNPDLVRPLLDHLANDPSEDVRQSAAGRLGEYLDHSGVRAALEQAQINDSSRSVRRTARSSLGQIDQ